MKSVKKMKFIIIALVLLLIILIGVFILINKANNTNTSSKDDIEKRQDTVIKLAQNTVKEKNTYTIIYLNDIVQKLFDYIANNSINTVYNLTSLNYIQKNNITANNVSTIYTNSKGKITYYIQDVYSIQTYEEISYYIYGRTLKNAENKVGDYYIKINVDLQNKTFSIEPLKVDEYNKAKNGEINQIKSTDIQINANNKYNVESFSTEKLTRRYINDFIFKMKYIPDVAFSTLDEKYRNKKFSNIDEFKSYIENNSERFNNFILKSYWKDIKNDSIEYEVEDINNYYYKIKASSGMDYTIILDDYTVESNEYVQKYNSSSDSTKIATCINKFFKLIDSKEYKSAYAYLDDTFKQKNFDTVGKFETYAKQNFFNNNTVTISSAEKVGDIYSCKVQIKSGVSVAAMSKDITVIIKLKENTDFVMSFSINK